MLKVNRTNNLKISKKIKIVTRSANNADDIVAIKKAIALAENKKINTIKERKKVYKEDKELKIIEKIPSNASELIVITVAKKNYVLI